jgi:aldose 1-epimerase
VALWADSGFPYLQVFTGDTLAKDVRRRGLGVEPMTCAPDAFNSGAGLTVLKPGQELVTQWGLAPTGYGAG